MIEKKPPYSLKKPAREAHGKDRARGPAKMSWKVGPVQRTRDDPTSFDGRAFTITTSDGKPVAIFGYDTEAEAQRAAKLVSEALVEAKFVAAYLR